MLNLRLHVVRPLKAPDRKVLSTWMTLRSTTTIIPNKIVADTGTIRTPIVPSLVRSNMATVMAINGSTISNGKTTILMVEMDATIGMMTMICGSSFLRRMFSIYKGVFSGGGKRLKGIYKFWNGHGRNVCE